MSSIAEITPPTEIEAVEFALTHEWQTLREIADEAGLSRYATKRKLRALVEQNRAVREPDGSRFRLA